MRILLIAGGWSSEKEVSLAGAKEIKKSLLSLGHEVTLFNLTPNLNELIKYAKNHDFAFINLHGSPGEDGTIQALLEDLKIPYQGSRPFPSFLCLNKLFFKQILLNHNLPTPKWTLYKKDLEHFSFPSEFPLIIKPNLGGSSVGIKIIKNQQEFLNLKLNPETEYLIEEFIQGTELTCGVLGQKALPPVLIKPNKSFFFDYTSKYEPNGAEEICPAPIENSLTQTLQELALKVHTLFGLSDYSRTDFMLDKKGNIYILEVNTLPGMTPTSLLPKEAQAIGLNFSQLIKRLLELGLEKNK
ncbi:D-alanine--D-alanine ligase family protein [Desulfonauticus submarinus]